MLFVLKLACLFSLFYQAVVQMKALKTSDKIDCVKSVLSEVCFNLLICKQNSPIFWPMSIL